MFIICSVSSQTVLIEKKPQTLQQANKINCVRACVRVCERACVRVCVCDTLFMVMTAGMMYMML